MRVLESRVSMWERGCAEGMREVVCRGGWAVTYKTGRGGEDKNRRGEEGRVGGGAREAREGPEP